MPKARSHCTEGRLLFPQVQRHGKYGKCSSLVSKGCFRRRLSGGQDRDCAGLTWPLSTDSSTAVENVEKGGRPRPHRPPFLLIMGKAGFCELRLEGTGRSSVRGLSERKEGKAVVPGPGFGLAE